MIIKISSFSIVIFQLLLLIVIVLIDLLFILYWDADSKKRSKKKTYTREVDPLLTKSAVELAKMIKEGKITSEQLVKTHIEQIKRVNKIVNAVVSERFQEALEEAKEKDHIFAMTKDKDSLPVFHGVRQKLIKNLIH